MRLNVWQVDTVLARSYGLVAAGYKKNWVVLMKTRLAASWCFCSEW